MKPIKKCQSCSKLEKILGKDYGLCTRAKKRNGNKNPYRALNDSCPAHPKNKE